MLAGAHPDAGKRLVASGPTAGRYDSADGLLDGQHRPDSMDTMEMANSMENPHSHWPAKTEAMTAADGEFKTTDLAVGGSSPSRRASDQQVCRSSDEASRWCRVVRSGRNPRSNPEEQLPQHDATGWYLAKGGLG